MEINGKTAVYGLIGNPVGHSFSPLIHNLLAEGLGVNLVYETFPVADESMIPDAVKGAYALGVQGMNVTVPYKSAVIPNLPEVDPIARAIGAVNTLVRQEPGTAEDGSVIPGGYKGYNTDYPGLFRALTEMGIVLKEMSVILIGAGGAARAAGFMCGDAGVRKLCILNRTPEKAQHLAGDLKEEFPDMAVSAQLLSEAAAVSMKMKSEGEQVLVIQCTNVGLAPKVENVPVEDPVFYENLDAAYDCIYNPEETRFLSMVKAAGKPGRNGMDMLLWQGILSFEHWTGKRPDRELVEKIRHRLYEFFKSNGGSR